MSTPPGPPPHPERKLTRDRSDAWLGGVASGIAAHLGWPVWLVRLCFVGLAFTNFLTVGVYAVLWILMPASQPGEQPPGLQAASHQGMRQAETSKGTSTGRIIGIVMVGLGLTMVARMLGMGPANSFFWPVLLAAIGVGLVWLQADDDDEIPAPAPGDAADTGAGRHRLARLISRRRLAEGTRVVGGMTLIGCAVALAAASQGGVSQLPMVAMVAGLTIAGVAVVAAPWILRYRRKMAAAYEEKLIADTRADMAAHLHDSVLQTLALIQRQADDPKQVAALARRQERELRSWLYADQAGPSTLKAALTEAGGEVEDERGVPVEVVCVGDIELTDDLRALVQAAREAMMNAAKHSGASLIDVYAEVEPEEDASLVQVFVRDRGKGFDPGEIADDRMGVRKSIVGRMERHGGTAKIRSAPGEGTEIRLEMKA
ncbi:ATP-binding protein [Propionimicrobium sp. PCR01-08-3]|uniref:ATP-binding protein n=1 Tax=Propionimicrobium sp. PCR01-08-3 TaxID=3052086 RepID=UPI00255CD027|nr:ATP-binding protein [Propionimicrobium sp. PCR01-08-3]WIY83266.1 PspC domain-containing protein [Propionimicrobium sp. PCR01-08-3]